MLPKSSRISRKQFPAGGRRVSFAFGTITHTPARSKETRFAVVVPKKAVATAVERNLLRRRAYAALRGYKPSDNRTSVIYLDKRARNVSYSELKAALLKALS